MLDVVEKIGSNREYRVLLNLIVTRYENQMKRTMLRPVGPLQHAEVQRMYQKLCTLNDAESTELTRRIANISKQVIAEGNIINKFKFVKLS